MIWIDWVFLAIIVVSTLISLIRGFVREILSLVAWVGAFWVAVGFASDVAPSLTFVSDSEMMRVVAAFITLFLVTLILAALVNFLIGKLVDKTGLTGTDRAVGMVFGLARGVALVTVVIVLGLVGGLHQQEWWDESRVIDTLQPLAEWLVAQVPED